MKAIVLASGSKGNATLIMTKTAKILIDCGISHRQLVARLNDNRLDLEQLDAILITHEHTDHIQGLVTTLKRHPVPVFLTEATYQNMYFKTKSNINPELMNYIEPYDDFYIKDVTITPIRVSHDASDAVGYVLSHINKKLVYLTDIGYLPKNDYQILANADIYIFESNYDVTMLFTSQRPFYLKQRIDSVKGHMSNTDSAYNMTKLVGENTKYIVLAHPSRECNTKDIALSTYQEVFTDYGIDHTKYSIVVATQDIPTDIFEI